MDIGSSDRNSGGVIPPSMHESTEGLIFSDQLPRVPRQDLLPGETDAFLEFLYSSVARRPRPLSLEQGAAVVRYLDALAWETEPGPVRQLLESLRDVIWGTLRLFAPFDLSNKQEAVEFLEEHADTYLAGFDVATALKRVRDAAPPMRYAALFRPPRLMSRIQSSTGLGDPHLREDLTERIYAAYHALRKAGVRNARGRVAEALNKQGLSTQARGGTLRKWGGDEVYERVKQCEAGWKKRNLGKRGTLRGWRDSVVNKWVYLFQSTTLATGAKGEGSSESGGVPSSPA